jgi:hypothetical protein
MGVIGVWLGVVAMRQGNTFGERNIIALLGIILSGLSVILALIPLLLVVFALLIEAFN